MSPLLISVCLAILLTNIPSHAAGEERLDLDFYRKTCPQLDSVVRNVVKKWFSKDKSIPAGLLRLHFHDCFVRGCDASILIDSTEDNIAEKDAVPNLTLRGFGVIDEIKSQLEKSTCRGIVSCADILTLGTRDAVALSGGPDYRVPLGRRDGLQSRIGDVHLPGPTFSIDAALSAFEAVGLNLTDLATLLGAHRIGLGHCGFFSERLYDFRGSGMQDPSMDLSLVLSLRKVCPPPGQITDIRKDPKVFLDQTKDRGSVFSFDNGFYQQVLNNKALFQIDQELLSTDVTSELVVDYASNEEKFKAAFAASIIKLGSIGVLTGINEGEIRGNCRAFNNNN